jgi:hypothetical protein
VLSFGRGTHGFVSLGFFLWTFLCDLGVSALSIPFIRYSNRHPTTRLFSIQSIRSAYTIYFYYTSNYLHRTLFRVIMPCKPRYTARRLAFTLSILPVFPFNFSRYLRVFTLLSKFLRQILSSHALADKGWGGVPLVAPFAQIILVRQIVTSLHHFVVTSSSPGLECQTLLRFLNLPAAPISTP